MNTQIDNILTLSSNLQGHLNLTHWAISKRVSSKSDYLSGLQSGKDTGTKIAERVIQRFSDIWPEDLEWPSHISRPYPAVIERRKAS